MRYNIVLTPGEMALLEELVAGLDGLVIVERFDSRESHEVVVECGNHAALEYVEFELGRLRKRVNCQRCRRAVRLAEGVVIGRQLIIARPADRPRPPQVLTGSVHCPVLRPPPAIIRPTRLRAGVGDGYGGGCWHRNLLLRMAILAGGLAVRPSGRMASLFRPEYRIPLTVSMSAR